MEMDHTDATSALIEIFSNILNFYFDTEVTIEVCRLSLDKIARRAEGIVTRVHAEQAGGGVACGAGCSYCCHAQVKLTPMEALVLFSWLKKTFTEDQQTALKKRITNNRELTEDVDLEHRVGVKDLTPCIFLDKGDCSIYPVRPLICRAWTSYDRATCESAFISGDHTAEIEASASSDFVYSLARHTIEKTCKLRGWAWVSQELPRAMAYCFTQKDLFNRWVQGTAHFKTSSPDVCSPEIPGCSFMEIQVPAFFRRFSLSYRKDGRCIEYFLYSREKKHEISTSLIVSYDVYAKAINVSKFYPEIYKESFSRYMSAACFFMMMHHAAGLFDIHCDCSICLETRAMVFKSFYQRLKDFDFIIHQCRISDNCNVRGRYHDFPVETGMITLAV